jgi:heptaprenyl diphosphate synthase
MPWRDKTTSQSAPIAANSQATRRRAHIALFAAVAVLLFVVERLLPNPVPWVRLGLANVVTLIVLWEYGAGAAAAVLVLRLILGGFFAASLLGPQFWLAASGGAASFLVMTGALRFGQRWWSPLGVSVLGSVAHACAQMLVVAVIFDAGFGVVAFLPVFLFVSLLTGVITGMLADTLLARLDLVRHPQGALPAGALDRPGGLG